jgi:hypothetical protein
MKLISFLIANWDTLVFITVVFVCIILKFDSIFKGKINEWLLTAVGESENKYGCGTGEVKKASAYDAFMSKFKFMSYLISKDKFYLLVADAVTKLKALANENPAIAQLYPTLLLSTKEREE